MGSVLASFSRPKIRQNANGKWLRGWPLDPTGGTTGRQCGSSVKQDHSCSAAHGPRPARQIDRPAGNGRATGAPPPRFDEIFCGSVETVLALVSLVSI